MDVKKDQHAFDVSLAIEVGIEKAILLGGIHYWITENEKRKSDLHFRLGEYWTYDTADGFALKYPYLKAKSIYRWMTELERDGWVKTERFKLKGVLDQTRWYGRGKQYLKWLNRANSQNEKSEGEPVIPISHFDPAISQNETPISHFDPSDSHFEKSLYKDTVVNPVQTAVDKRHSLSNPGEEPGDSGDVLEVETEEVFSATPTGEQGPQTPGCAPPLSADDAIEIELFIGKLWKNNRVIEGLSRICKLRDQAAYDWIERFVIKQWSANNLVGRTDKDLMLHCGNWIEGQLKIQKEHEQRQLSRSVGRGNRQSKAETGVDIDRLAEELFDT